MALLDILSAYRRTVHQSKGKSPSMLMFGRQLKTRIDLMIPNVDQNKHSVEENCVRSFEENDRVAARYFMAGSEKWKFGIVAEKVGKLHYLVRLDDGRLPEQKKITTEYQNEVFHTR